VYAVGDVSGAHLKPAVTVGFWLAGRFPARAVLPYVGSQCGGALLASLTVRLLFPTHPTLGATLPADGPGQPFVLELLLTLILMFVVLSVSTGAKEKGIAGKPRRIAVRTTLAAGGKDGFPGRVPQFRCPAGQLAATGGAKPYGAVFRRAGTRERPRLLPEADSRNELATSRFLKIGTPRFLKVGRGSPQVTVVREVAK
jgi:hypothetical protein